MLFLIRSFVSFQFFIRSLNVRYGTERKNLCYDFDSLCTHPTEEGVRREEQFICKNECFHSYDKKRDRMHFSFALLSYAMTFRNNALCVILYNTQNTVNSVGSEGRIVCDFFFSCFHFVRSVSFVVYTRYKCVALCISQLTHFSIERLVLRSIFSYAMNRTE